MPYVTKERQAKLINGARPENAGELNFLLTRTVLDYMAPVVTTYRVLNDVVGALESAKAEFQRRVVAPYEDRKIHENGDVYPLYLLGEGAGSPEHLAVAEILHQDQFVTTKRLVAETYRRNPETGAREVWVPSAGWTAVEG